MSGIGKTSRKLHAAVRGIVERSVKNGRKNSRSDPFCFSLLSVRFRIYGVPFPYLRKWERGFSVRFRGIPFSPEIDPYLFRFSSHFKSI
jgi:hypothetical protein